MLKSKSWFMTGAFLLVALLMVSGESFWVDEASTALYSQIMSFRELLKTLLGCQNSEAQMPFYILFVWFWGKLVPPAEWALRASNLIWLAGTIGAAVYIGRREKTPFFPILLLLQPFLWRYVNEFRPYAMQICFSSWQLAAVLDFLDNRNLRFRGAVFMGSSVGICGASMLGIIPTMIYAVVWSGAYLLQKKWPERNDSVAFITGGVCLAGLGGYFLKTLLSGAGGARLWTLSAGNLIFSGYELSGMVGLGPSLLSIRTAALSGMSGLADVMLPYVPLLVVFISVLCVLFFAGWLLLWRNVVVRKRCLLQMGMLIGIFVGMVILALIAKWPFWGRHLAPVLPIYCLLLSQMVIAVQQKKWGLIAVGLCVLLTGWSSLLLRFSPRHAREDYRQAVELAKQYGESHRVWWVAHGPAAEFYGMEFVSSTNMTGVVNICQSAVIDIRTLPDLVLINRPEATDSSGRIREFLRGNDFQKGEANISGFSVWNTSR